MILECISRYTSNFGTFAKGQVTDELSDEDAARLLRDSPGSFEEKRAREKVAVVTEDTDSAVKAPDRRARGGKKRG